MECSLPSFKRNQPVNPWLVFMAGMVLVSGCVGDPNASYIQGTWFYNDPHLQEVVGESFQEVKWTFYRGSYQVEGCCFSRFSENGQYRIIDSEGDKLTIELFNINGQFDAERYEVAIIVDRESDQLIIQGMGLIPASFPESMFVLNSSQG